MKKKLYLRHSCAAAVLQQCYILGLMSFRQLAIFFQQTTTLMNVEGVTLVLPSRLFMFNKYWRILALS